LRTGEAKHPVLTRPLGRGIAETGNSDPARQATFHGGFEQIRCEKGERDRHVASTLAKGDGSRQPSANELDGARYQGKHVAQIAAKLADGH
jgi:hypothetical protein